MSWCGGHKGPPRQTHWGAPDGVSSLGLLHAWLASLESKCVVNWRNLDVWNVRPGQITTPWDRPAAARRAAVFDTLVRLVPNGAPVLKAASEVCIFGPVCCSNASYRFETFDSEEIAAHLDMLPTEYEEQFAQYFMSFGGRVPLPTSAIVPPEIHARILWRAQFESSFGEYGARKGQVALSEYTFEKLLGFRSPFNWRLSSKLELTLCLMRACKEVALRAAMRWHRVLLRHGPCERPYELLSAYREQQPELGRWSDMDYSPVGWVSVGMKRVRDTSYENVFLTVL